ncbi:MAG: hypothetical protein ACRDHL_11860 [Candidatus Promineifilaceae bacterium]
MPGRTQSQARPAGGKARIRQTTAFLLIVTGLLYLPPYLDAFVGDDFVQQWRIRAFVGAPAEAFRVFSPYWTNWYFRPLQNLWFLGNRLLFGLEPAGYYGLQLGWHFLAVSLVFALGRQLGLGRLGAFVAAALFAVNAQHQLIVGWISSIGNIMSLVFSLAALVSWLAYVRGGRRPTLLLATAVLSALALLAHESAIVLPLILAASWWLTGRRRPTAPLLAFFTLLVAAGAAYIYLQLERPNAHLSVGASLPAAVADSLLRGEVGAYLATLALRWSALAAGDAETQLVAGLRSSPLMSWTLVLAAALAAFWLHRKGGLAARLGLLWAALYIGFFYAVLWAQEPALLDSRHLYFAWAGLALVLGAAFERWQAPEPGKRPAAHNTRRLAVVIGLLLFLMVHAGRVDQQAQGLATLARQVEAREAQLKAFLPSAGPTPRLFAVRFLLSADYFAPAAAVWYTQPAIQGGDLQDLLAYDRLTPNFYLFDEEDGRLANIMPALQEATETILLWRRPPAEAFRLQEGQRRPLAPEAYESGILAGEGEDRRMAVRIDLVSAGATTLGFRAVLPDQASLAFGLMGGGPADWRVYLLDRAGRQHDLTDLTLSAAEAQSWREYDLDLSALAGQEGVIYFEGRAKAPAGARYYVANPRMELG